jgi:hypothetical protein
LPMVEHLISGSIASGFIGALWGLIKLVTWLVKKRLPDDETTVTSGQSLNQHIEMMKTQLSQHLEGVHQISTYIIEDKVQQEYLRHDISAIKNNQDILNTRIAELVASQTRLVDRLGEMVQRMDRILEIPRGQ